MIICCGEALIDFIPTKSGEAYQPCPGGSILNIAVGLGRMNVPVGFLSRLSTDIFGDRLADYLSQNNVDLSYCPRVPGQTTLAFVSLEESGFSEPQYAFYAKGAVDRLMTIDDLPEVFGEDIDALHFGSISLVLEPGATTLETLMKRESRRRVLTLDPNVRPIVISEWGGYRQRFLNWVSLVDILRLSEADLSLLYPDHDIEALLPTWFDTGLSLVILTQGSSGSRAYTAEGVKTFVPSVSVPVVDTVGAGDTFFSAVLTHLHENGILKDRSKTSKMSEDLLTDCLSFATSTAAINCSRKGADPPTREEVAAWIKTQS